MALSLRASFRASYITRSYASAARPAPRKSTPPSKPKLKRKPDPSTYPTIECEEYQTLTLPDSRKLGYSEYGPSNGPVLLFFHGFPGSRIDARGVAGTKTRVIGIDRPGYGLSTFQKNRKMVDWPADVNHLVQHLGIKSFRILGISGGGPYALACANAFSKDVLKATGVLSGSAPSEHLLGAGFPKSVMRHLGIVSAFMPLVRTIARIWCWWTFGRKINSRSVPVQVRTLRDMAAQMGYDGDEITDDIVNALKEPFRQGVNGYVEDILIMYVRWGFELEDVKAQNILLWYGDKDDNTPIEWGEYMANKIEGAQLKAFADETHFTLLANHEEQILRELMEAGK